MDPLSKNVNSKSLPNVSMIPTTLFSRGTVEEEAGVDIAVGEADGVDIVVVVEVMDGVVDVGGEGDVVFIRIRRHVRCFV